VHSPRKPWVKEVKPTQVNLLLSFYSNDLPLFLLLAFWLLEIFLEYCSNNSGAIPYVHLCRCFRYNHQFEWQASPRHHTIYGLPKHPPLVCHNITSGSVYPVKVPVLWKPTWPLPINNDDPTILPECEAQDRHARRRSFTVFHTAWIALPAREGNVRESHGGRRGQGTSGRWRDSQMGPIHRYLLGYLYHRVTLLGRGQIAPDILKSRSIDKFLDNMNSSMTGKNIQDPGNRDHRVSCNEIHRQQRIALLIYQLSLC